MSAKQILNYVANKASEEEAALILTRSRVTLVSGLNKVLIDEDGQFVNEHKQIVTCSIGSITGMTIPEDVVKPVAKPVAKVEPAKVEPAKPVTKVG